MPTSAYGSFGFGIAVIHPSLLWDTLLSVNLTTIRIDFTLNLPVESSYRSPSELPRDRMLFRVGRRRFASEPFWRRLMRCFVTSTLSCSDLWERSRWKGLHFVADKWHMLKVGGLALKYQLRCYHGFLGRVIINNFIIYQLGFYPKVFFKACRPTHHLSEGEQVLHLKTHFSLFSIPFRPLLDAFSSLDAYTY